MTRVSADSDAALVACVLKDRDEAAFRQLVERHANAAYRLALSVVRDRQAAEDAVQDAFLTVSRKLRRFDTKRSLRAWILGIVYRCSLKIRSRRARDTRPEEAAMLEPTHDPQPLQDASRRETLATVAAAVDRLPQPQRVAIALHYREGLTHAEVAAALGIPAGTAKSRIGRALETLRAKLGKRGMAFSPAMLTQLPQTTAGAALVEACVVKGIAGLTTVSVGMKVTLAAAIVLTVGTVVGLGIHERAPRAEHTKRIAVRTLPSARTDPSKDPLAKPEKAKAKDGDATAVKSVEKEPTAKTKKKTRYFKVNGKKMTLEELLKSKHMRVGPNGRLQRKPFIGGKGRGGGRAPPMGAPSGYLDEDGNWHWATTPKFAPAPRHYGQATLKGRVVDSTGFPLPGAEIWRLQPDVSRDETTILSGAHMDQLAKSDKDGFFTLRKQKAGEVILFANFLGKMTVPGRGLDTAHATTVRAREGETTEGIVLTVPVVYADYGRLQGSLVGPDGEVRASVDVWLDMVVRKRAGLDGRFDFGLVSSGTHVITTRQSGLEEIEETVQVPQQGAVDVTITVPYLQTGDLRIAGQVLDQRGEPVAGVALMLGAGSGIVRQVVSDANGQYAFEKLPEELKALKVTIHTYFGREFDPGTFRDVPVPSAAFTVRLSRTVEVVVKVVSAVDGKPIPQINHKILVPVQRDNPAGGKTEEWIPRQTGGHFNDEGIVRDIRVKIGARARLQVEVPGHKIWERDLDTDTDQETINIVARMEPDGEPDPEEPKPGVDGDPDKKEPTDGDAPPDPGGG